MIMGSPIVVIGAMVYMDMHPKDYLWGIHLDSGFLIMLLGLLLQVEGLFCDERKGEKP